MKDVGGRGGLSQEKLDRIIKIKSGLNKGTRGRREAAAGQGREPLGTQIIQEVHNTLINIKEMEEIS